MWDREQYLLYDSLDDERQPSQILQNYWNSKWSQAEIEDTQRQLQKLRDDPILVTMGQQKVLEELTRRIQAVTNRK